ncbi:MAG: transglycosylase domain-containing protein [Bryobacteraceae bacterium]|nr:transglycosylase domain-containing protein [Bryobacteraceae bacterium]
MLIEPEDVERKKRYDTKTAWKTAGAFGETFVHIFLHDAPGRVRWSRVGPLILAAAAVTAFVVEVRTSWLQAKVFSAVAARMTYSVESGPSTALRQPASGPYDVRLGHARVPEFVPRLVDAGYDVQQQARLSAMLGRLIGWGLFPAYHEKSQAGLRVFGRDGELLYSVRFPERIYRSFEEIPPIVVHTILYIEDRELLDQRNRRKSPAVEWDRLGRATLGYGFSKLYSGARVSGGSTLATQMEKFRHSPGGRTQSAGEKMRQMASASLRSYLDGEDTFEARRRIVCEYLNSVPLAARAGFGEVHGLGDGLWAWFGADFDETNRLLADIGPDTAVSPEQALAYRRVLTLLMAIKKPGAFLLNEFDGLVERSENYLRALARDGVIPLQLREYAAAAPLAISNRAPAPPAVRFADRKGRDAVRIELLQRLGLQSTYDLDRLDLDVSATLDPPAQKRVTETLQSLTDPEYAAVAGLRQSRLLLRGDPSSVIYSVTVYERGPGYNRLRVQADNYDQPLNISEGTKLELGSTAKLRTLISYLKIVAELHEKYAGLSVAELRTADAPQDRLTQWVIAWLAQDADRGLPAMLEAAMLRSYSASPGEAFFTGGGLHTFSNFESKDNGRIMTVREAFERSVNLVFIRLMRDIAQYHTWRLPTFSEALLRDSSHLGRRDYLTRFADREGSQFLSGFYQKYEGLKPDETLQKFVDSIYKTPKRLAVIYRSVRPNDGPNAFAAFLIANMLNPNLSDKLMNDLYTSYAPGRFNLNDRAFLAGVHPLELWLVEYKTRYPEAGLSEILKASAATRQESYEWLFKARNKSAQDRAIRILLEVEAFDRLHPDWKSQGYPFARLVPSFATAIGSSGDTPGALAELMGVIVNGGVRLPAVRIESLRFAAATPFETSLARRLSEGERVLPAAVAECLVRELAGVVQKGTGRRAFGALAKAGVPDVVVGGKTGTGDNRFETYARGGRAIASRPINRTATFVFYIGDRLFGTITAFVPGEQAGGYEFTSSLPVQIFVELAPTLAQLLKSPVDQPPGEKTIMAANTTVPRRSVPDAIRPTEIPGLDGGGPDVRAPERVGSQ